MSRRMAYCRGLWLIHIQVIPETPSQHGVWLPSTRGGAKDLLLSDIVLDAVLLAVLDRQIAAGEAIGSAPRSQARESPLRRADKTLAVGGGAPPLCAGQDRCARGGRVGGGARGGEGHLGRRLNPQGVLARSPSHQRVRPLVLGIEPGKAAAQKPCSRGGDSPRCQSRRCGRANRPAVPRHSSKTRSVRRAAASRGGHNI